MKYFCFTDSNQDDSILQKIAKNKGGGFYQREEAIPHPKWRSEKDDQSADYSSK